MSTVGSFAAIKADSLEARVLNAFQDLQASITICAALDATTAAFAVDVPTEALALEAALVIAFFGGIARPSFLEMSRVSLKVS